MMFLWPFLLLGLLVLLGLWSIKDIKKKTRPTLLVQNTRNIWTSFYWNTFIIRICAEKESTSTEINSQSSSIMVSSQSDKSDDQSSSEAEASSKAQQESIAASEASEKAAYDASVKASSEAAVSSQNAASESAARASAAEEASKAVEAKSIAQQTIEQPAPQNDTGRTVFVTGGGKSNVYWYSTSSMPARTNKNNIITMTEADALAQGKRHSMTE